ncbi:MAG: IS110 family transposase, partial [Actinomycetia bacterium]|nr:IS110 family transposase [Actinomycetes bacterium]
GHNRDLGELVALAAPNLVAHQGVSRDVAAKLLITAGDNPQRIKTEAGFAALCGGVDPVPASSGKTSRHRLNRSGDRQANNALWVIAMVRLRHDPETRAYADRRKTEGLSHRETVRCIKRYLARRLYPILLTDLTRNCRGLCVSGMVGSIVRRP